MEELLSLFNRFTELVVKAFGSDPRFMTSRDKSYKLVINDTSVFRLDLPSSRARLEVGGRVGGADLFITVTYPLVCVCT